MQLARIKPNPRQEIVGHKKPADPIENRTGPAAPCTGPRSGPDAGDLLLPEAEPAHRGTSLGSLPAGKSSGGSVQQPGTGGDFGRFGLRAGAPGRIGSDDPNPGLDARARSSSSRVFPP